MEFHLTCTFHQYFCYLFCFSSPLSSPPFLSLFPLLSSLNTVHNLPGRWECFRLSWFGIGMTHRPSPHCRMFTHMAHPLALVATNSEPATDWMVDLALWLIEFRGRLYHTIAGPFSSNCSQDNIVSYYVDSFVYISYISVGLCMGLYRLFTGWGHSLTDKLPKLLKFIHK